MYRTHTCGCLRACNVHETVTLAGWVQKIRNLGAMTFIDLRDRYGLTQIVVEEHSPAEARETAARLGREWVIQVEGEVVERQSKNPKMPTGDIEVSARRITVLHEAEVPPFAIEEVSDGGDDLRMKYRYLDLRRPPLQRNLILRHKMAQEIRRFLPTRVSWRSRPPIWSPRPPKAPAISSFRAACRRTSSTPCRSRPRSSSSC